MRLLHVIPDLDPRSGGTVSALVGLAIAQRRLGWQVTVLTTISGEGTDQREILRLRAAGVSVSAVELSSRLASIRPIRAAVRAAVAGADVVHVHAVWEELQHIACREASDRGIPYVLSPHGMLDPWSLSQGKLKKTIYLAVRMRRHLNRAAVIHCTTSEEAKLLAPLRLTAPALVVPNGIDLAEFRTSMPDGTEKFTDRFPVLKGKDNVLFLSRIHPKKGLDLLLPAFARLANDRSVLVIAGPGEPNYLSFLRSECERLAITDRVVFTGMLNGAERVAAYRHAKLFVLPSYQENFGIAVIESLACGTPVIISEGVNLCELIRDSGVGEVVTSGVEALASAIESWLDAAAKRHAAGEKGIDFVQQFDFDSVARTWCQHLQCMIEGGHRACGVAM